MSYINIGYHPSYFAKKVEVYTADQRGTPWNQWTKMETLDGGGVIARVDLRQNHSRFISLRFFNWTNGYVGISRLQFGFLNGTRNAMSQSQGDQSHLIQAVGSSGQ